VWSALGCGDPTGPVSAPAPELEMSVAAGRPENVLSALVTARTRFTDSARVRYGMAGETLDSVTPSVRASDGLIAVPVLGLLPQTAYRLQLVGFGRGGRVESEILELTTAVLPDDLPSFQAGGPAPPPGYVVFAAGSYGLAIDNTGRVVWYTRFDGGPGLNFQPQANDRYIARPATEDPSDIEPLVEVDPLGVVTRRLGCAGGLQPRFHDALVQADGGYWALCDETRVMDLSTLGGMVGALVTGTVVQHLGPSGVLLFQWSPFDHFEIADLAAEARGGEKVNWTHGNALDLDAEGNLLVSFRSLGEITRIDTHTGAVLWRMGGLRNQFTFPAGDPPFVGQHGVRAAPGGFVVLDNLGEITGTRAERYEIDDASRSTRLTGWYHPAAATVAELGGAIQALPDGHMLVAFGSGAAVQEYDRGGRVVWQIEGDPGYVYRAQRIRSLYHPEEGLTR
jgi:hypothetical protein